MVRVVVYDDNTDRRESLCALMQLMPELEVVGAFENCAQVQADMEATRPDLVLMDLEMPVQNGLYGIGVIKKDFSHIRIIVQTAYDDDDRVFAAFKAGAEGYLLKSASVAKISQCISDVMNGGANMSPSIAAKVMQFFEQQNALKKSLPFYYNLSPKELEILKKLSIGKSYKIIANELDISYFTVNNHVKKIYEKLQVHSLGEAIGLAYREGLV
jgi:DNA-binding NarL/FixJ family response regulator